MGTAVDRCSLRIALIGSSVLLLLGMVQQHVSAAGVRQAAGQNCSALGTYTVGPRFVPQPPVAGAPPPPPAVRIYPYAFGGYLSGTLSLTAYTGCGLPTAGAFALHSLARPLPSIRQPGAGAAPSPVPGTAIVTPVSSTTVLTATGTFAQDPAHANDAAYVLVNATISYGRYLTYCTRLCPDTGGTHTQIACLDADCSSSRPVVTRVATINSVTGFLHWQSGVPAQLGLVFLPPPDPAAGAATLLTIQPLAFMGRRTSG